MRRSLNPASVERLVYEIREIVKSGKIVEKHGTPITWENIGDPIAKGEIIPIWMKEILKRCVEQDSAWGYCPTSGLPKAVDYLIQKNNARATAQVKLKDGDILFFNGLGDAVATIYSRLAKEARVILPSPCYSAHALGESDHAFAKNIFYKMDPHKNWQADLEDLEFQIQKHPNIVAILLINPDNPTGAVHSKESLKCIIALAKKYGLFIVADEIYGNLTFGETPFTPIVDIIEDVPAISMQGLSKEVPWPGSRCGWIEIYNREKDPEFEFYIQRILDCKMSQVCSTTMPQMVLSEILEHPEYQPYVSERKKLLAYKTEYLFQQLSKIPEVILSKPQGALYFTVAFKEGVLNEQQTLKIANQEIKSLIEGKIIGQPLDKRFVYYLLGSKGVCTVPLSSFFTHLHGFRMTLLETNMPKFERTANTIIAGLKEYFNSVK